MPTVIASQLVGVQPMTGAAGSIFTLRARYPNRHRFLRLSIDEYGDDLLVPDGYCVVDVDWEIRDWIREQPIHLWKDHDRSSFLRDRFVIADELYTTLALRWM